MPLISETVGGLSTAGDEPFTGRSAAIGSGAAWNAHVSASSVKSLPSGRNLDRIISVLSPVSPLHLRLFVSLQRRRNNFNFGLRMNLNNYILSSEDHGSLLLTQLNPWNCSSLAECCIRAGGTLQLIVKLNVQNNFNFSFWTSFSSNNATWRIVL